MIVIDEITDDAGGSAVVRIFARDFAKMIIERDKAADHARALVLEARNEAADIRGRLESSEKRHEIEITLLRDALVTMLTAKTKGARKDAEKEARQALDATKPPPF
jgi:hypothetical protein